MRCNQTETLLDDYLDGQVDDTTAAGVALHVQGCAGCRRELETRQSTLDSLRRLPVDGPGEDFLARAVDTAARRSDRARQPGTRRILALAAVLAVAVWGSFLVMSAGPAGPAPSHVHPAVTLAAGTVTPVRLVFTSAEPLRDARLSIELPVGLEVDGFDGQTALSWTTDLEAGRNVLRLPLIGRVPASETLVARLEHPAGTKTFELDVTVI